MIPNEHPSDPTRARILVVEDDESIAAGLALNLRLEGYDAAIAHDGPQALELLRQEPPSLILLDINLPRKSGLEVLSELRNAGDETPVIVLSAREDEYDKVAALRLGADDYVTKPFALAELMARVHVQLRRQGSVPRDAAQPLNPTPIEAEDSEPDTVARTHFGDVTVELATRQVLKGGEETKLTHLEFELLWFFLRHPSVVLPRSRLLREVWGMTSGSPRTVDNFVGQLRAKLEDDPVAPRHFITVRGSGYRFDPCALPTNGTVPTNGADNGGRDQDPD